jgi:hypothetical protein
VVAPFVRIGEVMDLSTRCLLREKEAASAAVGTDVPGSTHSSALVLAASANANPRIRLTAAAPEAMRARTDLPGKAICDKSGFQMFRQEPAIYLYGLHNRRELQ